MTRTVDLSAIYEWMNAKNWILYYEYEPDQWYSGYQRSAHHDDAMIVFGEWNTMLKYRGIQGTMQIAAASESLDKMFNKAYLAHFLFLLAKTITENKGASLIRSVWHADARGWIFFFLASNNQLAKNDNMKKHWGQQHLVSHFVVI